VYPAFAAEISYGISDETLFSLLFFGLLIGIVFSATAYLFFAWIVMRDKGQVFMVLFLLCLGIRIFASNDMLMEQIGLGRGADKEFLQLLSLILSWIFALSFTYYFLELDVNSPGFTKPFIALIGILCLLFSYFLYDRAVVYYISSLIGAIVMTAVLVGGLFGLRNNTSGSFVHIIAFICFFMGVMAEPMYDISIITNNEMRDNIIYISFALSALMFAIVVTNQFASRQDEKEKALALSNERFTLATKGAQEGLFDWNLMTNEVFFSDQFRRIIGFRLANGVSGLKTWLRLIDSSDRKGILGTVRRLLKTPSMATMTAEYVIKRPDGLVRWMHTKVIAVRDKATQKVIRMVGSTSDITDRKNSESALIDSEARLRSIIEANPVPVFIVDLKKGRILYATPGAENLLSMKVQQIENLYLQDIIPSEETREKILGHIIRKEPVDGIEALVICQDEKEIPSAVSARSITYQGVPAMVMGIYDLTEQKKAQEQIVEQQEALQQSEKMAALGGLLAGVAHELNNPLSVVVGQSTLIMEGTPEKTVATRAEKIFKAADRCSRIVKSFLAIARRKPPERKKVDLNQIIRGALDLLGYQIRTSSIEVESILDDKLKGVWGDNDQLTQVVMNVLLNAVQALDGWSGVRKIKIVTAGDDKNRAVLTVSDTGPGIPEEIRTKIFEPFFTTKGGKGGTGIGLSLCLNIVTAHGGEMEAGESPDSKSVFTIKLPLAEDNAHLTLEDGADVKPPPMSLLIVDDEIELAQTLADLLDADGHKIDMAINGRVALNKIKKEKFDAIISDLRMPVMDGPALYEELVKEFPAYVKKIAFVTGDTLSPHVQEFLRSHELIVVEKPYKIKDIRQILMEIVEQSKDK